MRHHGRLCNGCSAIVIGAIKGGTISEAAPGCTTFGHAIVCSAIEGCIIMGVIVGCAEAGAQELGGVAMELVTAKTEVGAVLDAVMPSSMSMVVPVKNYFEVLKCQLLHPTLPHDCNSY